MSNVMQGGAVVEPAAVRKMKNDTDKLGSNIEATSKKLLERLDELNKKGFQDGNFQQLHDVVHEQAKNLEKLVKIMTSFSNYLEEVEKNISSYVNGPKLVSSNIKVK